MAPGVVGDHTWRPRGRGGVCGQHGVALRALRLGPTPLSAAEGKLLWVKVKERTGPIGAMGLLDNPDPLSHSLAWTGYGQ